MTYDATKSAALVADATADEERMTPAPWSVGEDDEECAATLRAAPVISGQAIPCGPPIDVIIPFGRAYSDARGIASMRNRNAQMAEQLKAAGERLREVDAQRQALAQVSIDTVATLQADRDRLAARVGELEGVLAEIRDDFDRAIAEHGPSDPRHRSHGGQHHNGRCCAFGNVTPSALSHMRRLRDAIDSTTKKGT